MATAGGAVAVDSGTAGSVTRPRRFGQGEPCARCNDGYELHEPDPSGPGRGRCLAEDADGRCPCLGFWWVDVLSVRAAGY